MSQSSRPRNPFLKSSGFVLAFALALWGLTLVGCGKDERTGNASSKTGKVETSPSAAPGRYGSFPQIFADVAEGALPSVVSIYTEHDAGAQADPFEYFFGGQNPDSDQGESGLGSGVIMDGEGHILTNFHVIEGAIRIRVQYHDGKEFSATVVGSDPPTDLAVLRITPDERKSAGDAKAEIAVYPAMPSGDSEKLRVGEWVIAVGSPYGLSQTVTTGIISAKGRNNTGINSYENFLQTDAAINPGNSGGALLNLNGELVGINTAIFSRSGGYQGIGFAIPVNMARKVYADLLRDGEVTRGWLGVSIQPLDPALAEALGVSDRRGALVGGVIPGSPADKAGIRRGDVITTIDDREILDPNTLLNHIALLTPGSWATIVLNRAGKAMTFKARITKRSEGKVARAVPGSEAPEDSRVTALGLRLESLTPGLRRDYDLAPGLSGAFVSAVQPGGRADQAGLVEGDVILEANRIRIKDPRDFQDIVRKAGQSGRILLVVSREGETFFTTL
jgi:serine protease Do